MDIKAKGVVKLRVNADNQLPPGAPAFLERLSPDAVEVYEEILEKLGFSKVTAANEEEEQFVLDGQVLVLEDAREGKTSLTRALVGKVHDPEQAKTRAVVVWSRRL